MTIEQLTTFFMWCTIIGGGLLVGVAMRGMEIGAAARIYTQLTIGDGLVSQVPALMISLAAGIVVTRVASEGEELHLGQQLGAQLFGKPRSLLVAAGLLTLLALVPGLPGLPFGDALGAKRQHQLRP